MINWETELVTSPPILRQISDEDLRKYEDSPLEINVPSNTQHVERFIQLMAKNATREGKSKLRDGLCKATIKNRQIRPKLEQKSDFDSYQLPDGLKMKYWGIRYIR